jgi:hypothetical protein
VPGALSMASSHMVWIESMTTRVASFGRSRLAVMSRTLIEAASSIGQSATAQAAGAQADLLDGFLAGDVEHAPPLCARRGGGLQQQRGFADAGIAADQHRRSGTRPPPSTRSSSAMPVAARGGGAASPTRPTNATARPTGLAGPARFGPRRGVTASSTMVFHSPQPSQRPDHLLATAPQLWQTKREVGLATPVSVRAAGTDVGRAWHGATRAVGTWTAGTGV